MNREFISKTVFTTFLTTLPPVFGVNGQSDYNDGNHRENETQHTQVSTRFVIKAISNEEEDMTSTTSTLIDINAFYTFLFAFLFVASVLGNGLVGLVLYRKKSLSPSSRLVFSLCGSNFLLSCFVLPFTLASSLVLEWKFGLAWCTLTAFLVQLVVSASNLTLAAIAIDRYFAIVKPMSYSVTVTSLKSYIALLFIWILSLVINVPPLFNWPEIVYETSISTCRVHIETNPFYAWLLLGFDFLLPAVIMTTSYGCIFQVARSKYKKIHIGTVSASIRHLEASATGLAKPNDKDNQATSTSSKRNYVRKPSWLSIVLQSPVKGFAVISCILGVFYLCWVPHIVTVLLTFNKVIEIDSIHRRVTFCLATLSLPCYPLIYGLLNRSIRKDLITWLKDKKCGANKGATIPKRPFPRNSSAASTTSSVTLGLLDYTPPFTQWNFKIGEENKLEIVSTNNHRKMSEDSGRFSLPADDTDSASCSSVTIDSNKDAWENTKRVNSMEVLEEEDSNSGLFSINVRVDHHETYYNQPDDGVVLDSESEV